MLTKLGSHSIRGVIVMMATEESRDARFYIVLPYTITSVSLFEVRRP